MSNEAETIEPITYRELKISTFELLYIKDLEVTASINDHSTLKMVGILSEDKKDEDIHTSYNTPIEVYASTDDGKERIYFGIITKVRVKKSAEYYELHIEAKSYTYLMDIKRTGQSKVLQKKLTLLGKFIVSF